MKNAIYYKNIIFEIPLSLFLKNSTNHILNIHITYSIRLTKHQKYLNKLFYITFKKPNGLE